MKQIDFVNSEKSDPNTADSTTARTQTRKTSRAGSTASTKTPQGTSTGPREGYKRLNADIPAALHKRIKMQALVEDRNITDIVHDALKYYLARQ